MTYAPGSVVSLADFRARATREGHRETSRGVTGLDIANDVADVLDRCARDPLFSAALAAALARVSHPLEALAIRAPLLGSASLSGISLSGTGTSTSPEREVIERVPRSGVLASVALTLPSCDSVDVMREAVVDALDADGVHSAWVVVGRHPSGGHVHAHGLVQFSRAGDMRAMREGWRVAHGGDHAARATIVTGWPAWVDARDNARETLTVNLGRVLAYITGRHIVASVVSCGELRRALADAPSWVGNMSAPREVMCRCGAAVSPARVARGWATCSARCSTAARQRSYYARHVASRSEDTLSSTGKR